MRAQLTILLDGSFVGHEFAVRGKLVDHHQCEKCRFETVIKGGRVEEWEGGV